MKAIGRFARLSSAEQRLLLSAGVTVAAFRLTLWLLPWDVILRLLPSSRAQGRSRFSVDRLAWAVRNASRLVPRATCLTQALALHHLLSRSGCSSSIHIGVAKASDSGFKAHAWVEHNGETILSSSGEVAQYSRLLTVEAL